MVSFYIIEIKYTVNDTIQHIEIKIHKKDVPFPTFLMPNLSNIAKSIPVIIISKNIQETKYTKIPKIVIVNSYPVISALAIIIYHSNTIFNVV